MGSKANIKGFFLVTAVLVALAPAALEAGICYDCGFSYQLVCVRVGRKLLCEWAYCEFCSGGQSTGFRQCSVHDCICVLEDPGCQVFLV